MRFSTQIIKRIIVYLIAAGCIVWIARDVRFNELFYHIRRMNPWWIIPAAFLDVITTVIHGFRWRLLLKPQGEITLFRTVQAIYTSLFSNEIFPLKAGEFVRGYLLSRWLNVPFSAVLPSMVTERVFDGSLLVIGFAIAVRFVSIPQGVTHAARIVGIIMLLAITVFVILALIEKKHPIHRRSDQTAGRSPVRNIAVFLVHFTDGIRSLRTSIHFAAVLIASFFYLFIQVLAYWMIMKAYGLNFSLWIPAVVLIIVRLGTAVPSAPGNIGPYQFFCVLALTLFGVEKTTATGFAVAMWLIFSIPILLLGLAAFLRSGLSLSIARHHSRTGAGSS